MSIVVADLPRAGLGNMLLVWAHAMLFASNHSLPLHCRGWGRFRIGPWLRREARKRWYLGTFKHERPYRTLLAERLRICTWPANATVFEPRGVIDDRTRSTMYVFRAVPVGPDYFAGLLAARAKVRDALLTSLSPWVTERLAGQTPPEIAIHVRRGDFRQFNEVTTKARGYSVLTPIDAFVMAAKEARGLLGNSTPVTVYTDGSDDDVAALLEMNNTARADDDFDIIHMLQLSRARILIPSPRSTFSYWSAFLAENKVMRMHYDGYCPVAADEVLASVR